MIHYDILAKVPGQSEVVEYLCEMPIKSRMKLLGILTDDAKALISKMPEEALKGLPGGPEIDTQTGQRLMLAVSCFVESGRPVYRVGKELQKAFVGMNLNKITKEEVTLPEDGLYIDVENADESIKLWGGDRTKWHVLRGIYAHKLPPGTTTNREGFIQGECWQLMFWGAANEESLNPQDDALFYDIFSVDTVFKNGIERHFKSILEDPSKDASPEGLRPPEGAERKKRNEGLIKALRIFINTVLYVTGSNPETSVGPETARTNKLKAQVNRAKSPGKISRIKRQLNNATKCNVRVLAPSIEKSGISRKDGTAKHTVKAHWHRYWVGSSHEKYETGVLSNDSGKRLVRLFVEEYTRGEDLSERLK